MTCKKIESQGKGRQSHCKARHMQGTCKAWDDKGKEVKAMEGKVGGEMIRRGKGRQDMGRQSRGRQINDMRGKGKKREGKIKER